MPELATDLTQIWNFCNLPGGCGTGCTSDNFGPSNLPQDQARSSYVRSSLSCLLSVYMVYVSRSQGKRSSGDHPQILAS